MDNSNNGKYSGFFSKKLRAGKRRTYFFDVRSTKQGDYFLTITESKKKFDGEGYDSHKIFLYKEDFKKFMEALNETLNYIKTDLMPDYDYESERPAKIEAEGTFAETRPTSNGNGNGSNYTAQTETNSAVTQQTNTPSISDDEEVDWN